MTDYREQQRTRADIDALKLKAGSTVWLMRSGASLANDASETAAFSKTLWGGTLSTGNGLFIEHHVTYVNNSGVNRNFSVRVKYGATTFFTSTITYPTSAVARIQTWRLYLMGNGATNSQFLSVEQYSANNVMDGFAGVFSLAEYSSAEDSSTDLAVSITWQHSAAAGTITASERLTLAHFVGAVS